MQKILYQLYGIKKDLQMNYTVFRFIMKLYKFMKKLKYISLLLLMFGCIFYYACDDAGVVPQVTHSGDVYFAQSNNLRVLNTSTDGFYYLWIQLSDSLGASRWRNLATFNVTASGQLVDGSNNPITPVMNPLDTTDIGRVSICLITIQRNTSTEPGPTRILGGTFGVYLDSVSANLRFNDPLALGSVGDTLMRVGTSRLYIINTPTNNQVNCERGIWFSDSLGNSYLPDISLSPGGGWQYRSWIYDRGTQQYTNMGGFLNPKSQDDDGAGSCQGSTPLTYNAPGQDWVTCNIHNMLDGNHEVFIVIEPEGRTANDPPFNFKIYYQSSIVPSLDCRRIDNVFGQPQNVPAARIRISRARP